MKESLTYIPYILTASIAAVTFYFCALQLRLCQKIDSKAAGIFLHSPIYEKTDLSLVPKYRSTIQTHNQLYERLQDSLLYQISANSHYEVCPQNVV